MGAARRYDPDRFEASGGAFSTYAVKCMYGVMMRYRENYLITPVDVKVTGFGLYMLYGEMEQYLRREMGQEPGERWVAVATSLAQD